MSKFYTSVKQVATSLIKRGKSITNPHKDEPSDKKMKNTKKETTPQAHKELYEDRGDLGAC